MKQYIRVLKWSFAVKTALMVAVLNVSLCAYNLSAQTNPFQWAKRVASTTNTDNELSIGMTLDSQGNVYVTGWFDGTNDFGGVVLTNRGAAGQDIFVAKYDPSGVLQWARRAGSATPYWDMGRGVGVDSDGNVYVTGGFRGDADFGTNIVSAPQNTEFFLAKYNSAGDLEWVRQSAGGRSFGVYGTGLAVDSAGNCYAVGFADNGATITFGTTNLLNPSLTGYSTFLVKYDNTGMVKWAQLMGGSDNTYATKVAVDAGGNVYVRGSFETYMTIGNSNLVTSGSEENMFIAKFDNSGALTWVKQAEGGDVDEGGVAVDQVGNVYGTGWFSDTMDFDGISLTSIGSYDAFLTKYNSSGIEQWARRAGGTNFDVYWDVALDQQGNVYAAGVLGPDAVAPSGSGGAIVAKYDPEGTVQWAYSATGQAANPVSSIAAKCAVDSIGNCYAAGWYLTVTTFGTNVLQPQGYWNFFLAKLAVASLVLSNPPAIISQPQNQTVTAGQTVILTVPASGTAPLTYQWRKDGLDISGQSAPTLILAAVQTNQSGSYSLVITNAYGSVTSSVAVLTVNPIIAPLITIEPPSQTVSVGQNVSLTVTTIGTAPLSYQWRREGTNLIGATSSSYSLPGVRLNQVGNYTVVVSNAAGSVTSSPPTMLAVNPATPGTVVEWGDYRSVPAGVSEVAAIAAGGSQTVALKSDGTVVAWAMFGRVQTNVPVGLNAVAAIAAGDSHVLALKNDGTVVAWGNNGDGQTNIPVGLSGVEAVAAGGSHSVALKTDGTVMAWGNNNSGQTDVPVGLSGVIAIAAGESHTVVLKRDGSVVAWGHTVLPPADLRGVAAFAAAGSQTVALKVDGTVVAWGANSFYLPGGLTGVVAIATGGSHTLALKIGGIVAWGNNGNGQTIVPVGLSGVTSIAAGQFYSVALLSTVGVVPTITAHSIGNSLTLLWPITASLYRVESALSLSPPITWSNVTGTFQTNGGSISIVLPTTGTQKFYRLVKP